MNYSNWRSNQPDNFVGGYDVQDSKAMVSPLGEHWVIIDGNSGKWADVGNHIEEPNRLEYAVFEFDNLNECLPPQDDADSDIDLSTPHCNTQIYDDKLNTLQQGQTFECQQDKYNTWYCPEALASADEYWDYEDGTSSIGYGTFIKLSDQTLENIERCPAGSIWNKNIQKCITPIQPEMQYQNAKAFCSKLSNVTIF